jgi:hypothetical protein
MKGHVAKRRQITRARNRARARQRYRERLFEAVLAIDLNGNWYPSN